MNDLCTMTGCFRWETVRVRFIDLIEPWRSYECARRITRRRRRETKSIPATDRPFVSERLRAGQRRGPYFYTFFSASVSVSLENLL